jgi:enamine deaminase RidA (YjgF/YER057c/UK114 family)
MTIEQKLKELNIVIPAAVAPVANYVSYVISGNQVIISGQIPVENGAIPDEYKGQLGNGFSTEDATNVARVCGLNILAQLKDAVGGDLEKVKNCVKLGIFVNSSASFTEQPVIANGASDLMVDVFGEKGKHARSAVGVSQLPFGVAVEIDAIFEI